MLARSRVLSQALVQALVLVAETRNLSQEQEDCSFVVASPAFSSPCLISYPSPCREGRLEFREPWVLALVLAQAQALSRVLSLAPVPALQEVPVQP